VSWPDRYLMCLLPLGSKFAGTSRKSTQAVCHFLLEDALYFILTLFKIQCYLVC
jgi:hypothetical protein